MTITGEIHGLKKGTVFLQKIEDTSLISVDSMVLFNDPKFTLYTQVDSGPEIYYLYLDKKDNSKFDDRLSFFVEPGEIHIDTTLDKFEEDAIIKGSENEKKLQEYQKMLRRFNRENLKLIKIDYEAQKQKDYPKLQEVDKQFESLLRKKYLYTINFALNNKHLEVAPYVVMSEVFDANVAYLDTVAQALRPRVRKSTYGQQLLQLIEKRKKERTLIKEAPATDSTQVSNLSQ